MTTNPSGRRLPLMLLAAVLLILPLLGSATDAAAHEGHAGEKKVFLATKLALKGMLPSGSKVVRRKQMLNDSQLTWADKTLHQALDRKQVVTYYLARDRTTDAGLAAAMTQEVAYRHGKMLLALGVDPEGRITRAAVLSIDGKYLGDLKRSLNGGWLTALKGVPVAALADRAQAVPENDPAAQAVLNELARMGATLAALANPV